jgi:hypothetical protein
MLLKRRTKRRGGRKSRRQTNGNVSTSTFTVDPTTENTSTVNAEQYPASAAYLSANSNGNGNNKNKTKNNTSNTLGNNPFGAISTNVLANTEEEGKAKREYANQFNQKKFTNVTNTLNTELPPGWRAVKYKNGNVYYENTKTGKTQYNYPDVTRAGNNSNLPEGWETYSYHGENFYVDPQGESHWNKPTTTKQKNNRQVVENELTPREEPTPGPLPPSSGLKNKNKNANNAASPAGLFGNNDLEVENFKRNSINGNNTMKANKVKNVEASPAGLFGNNELEVEINKRNNHTNNRNSNNNTNNNNNNSNNNNNNNTRNNTNNNVRTNNNNNRNNNKNRTRRRQTHNGPCPNPTCPICPKLPTVQTNNTQLKKARNLLANAKSILSQMKSSL